MKNLFISFIAFLFIQFTLFAQSPDTLWTKTFGEIADNEGRTILQTNNGNILVGGASLFAPRLICLDADGNEIWSKSWVNDSLVALYPSYVFPEMYELNTNKYVMGLQSNGPGIMWYDRSTDSTSVVYYNSYYWGIIPISVKKILDDGYMVAWNWISGWGIPWGNQLKVNLLGDTLWYKNYGEGGWEDLVWLFDVEPTNDGGYIILGGSEAAHLLLLKTNEIGDSLWTKNYNDTTKAFDIKCLLQTKDNGYIILVNVYDTKLPAVTDGMFLYRTDEYGDTLWSRNLGFFGDEVLNVMKPTSDGGFILVGSTTDVEFDSSDILIVKVDSLGYKQWSKSIGSSNGDYASDICVTSDGGYIIVGTMYSYGTVSSYIWVIRLGYDPVGIKENLSSLVPEEYSISQNYPNPFNPSTKIKYQIPELSFVTLKVYDVLGSEVAVLVNEEKPVGTYELNWNAANLPSGVYFYRLQAGDFVQTRKMIFLK